MWLSFNHQRERPQPNKTNTTTNMNWITLKSEVEADIKQASITNKKAITAILKFERRKNTLRNKLENGESWEAVTMSLPYYQAADMLEEYLQEGELCNCSLYKNEWKAYCDQTGIRSEADMGDHLC